MRLVLDLEFETSKTHARIEDRPAVPDLDITDDPEGRLPAKAHQYLPGQKAEKTAAPIVVIGAVVGASLYDAGA